MKIGGGWIRNTGAAVVLCLLASGIGRPQKGGSPSLPSAMDASDPLDNGPIKHKEDSPFTKSAEEKQAHLRNDERQKRLVSDTDRLLILANELHDDVGRTDKNILSIDVVRRADEIERLAHSVKERMKAQ